MNRYERHLNERLQQHGPWHEVGSFLAGLAGMAMFFVLLVVINVAFWVFVVWLFQKVAGG
jgi:hypothetical protein